MGLRYLALISLLAMTLHQCKSRSYWKNKYFEEKETSSIYMNENTVLRDSIISLETVLSVKQKK